MHEEFREILRFWFDRGVAGFRIDVAQGLYKDAQLRDDPPAPTGDAVSSRFGLDQVYSANRPESHGVFRDWRKIAESYPAAAAARRDLGRRPQHAGRVPRPWR